MCRCVCADAYVPMHRVARSAPLSARTPGKTLSLERRGCPANSTHAATLGNARKSAHQRRDASAASGGGGGMARPRRDAAPESGFAHRGKDTAKPRAGDPRHGKLSFASTALPRTPCQGPLAKVRLAKDRARIPRCAGCQSSGCDKDAKVKGAGAPSSHAPPALPPTSAPGNQRRRNGPPVEVTGPIAGAAAGEAARRHKGNGAGAASFRRSLAPPAWVSRFGRLGSPVGQTPPGQALSPTWEPPSGLTAVARQILLPRETECASTRR
jgi:hypothetical protein